MTTREKAYAKLEELKQLVLSESTAGEVHERLLWEVAQAFTVVLTDAINPYCREELPYILAALKIATSNIEKAVDKDAAKIADGIANMFSVAAVVLPADNPFADAARAAAEADL